MANPKEGLDQQGSGAIEAIDPATQERLYALCGLAGLRLGDLGILHAVLHGYGDPKIVKMAETFGARSDSPEDVRAEFREILSKV